MIQILNFVKTFLMPKKYKSLTPSIWDRDIAEIATEYRDITISEIKKKLKQIPRAKKPTPEKKVLMVKLLHLMGGNQTHAANVIGIPRESLNRWNTKIGEIVNNCGSVARIRKESENHISVIGVNDIEAVTAEGLVESINKLRDLLAKAYAVNHIYAVVKITETLNNIMKTYRSKGEEPQPKNNFYAEIANIMINGNKD